MTIMAHYTLTEPAIDNSSPNAHCLLEGPLLRLAVPFWVSIGRHAEGTLSIVCGPGGNGTGARQTLHPSRQAATHSMGRGLVLEHSVWPPNVPVDTTRCGREPLPVSEGESWAGKFCKNDIWTQLALFFWSFGKYDAKKLPKQETVYFSDFTITTRQFAEVRVSWTANNSPVASAKFFKIN